MRLSGVQCFLRDVVSVRACSASCARLIGVPCDGSGPCASAEDDFLRLLTLPLTFDAAELTGLLSQTVSKHCHVAAHIRSARADDTATALLSLAAD